MKNLLTTIIVALITLGFHHRSEAAAVDYFLEVDGINGQATAPGHTGQINLLNFTLQGFQRNLLTVAGGAASPALAQCRPVQLIIPTDQSWPLLFKACMTGQHIKKVAIHADYTPDGPIGPVGTFLTITLEDVVVASVEANGDRTATGEPTEVVSLSFSSLSFSFKPLMGNALGSPVTTRFNLNTNKSTE